MIKLISCWISALNANVSDDMVTKDAPLGRSNAKVASSQLNQATCNASNPSEKVKPFEQLAKRIPVLYALEMAIHTCKIYTAILFENK